jgi:hypothetical protein
LERPIASGVSPFRGWHASALASISRGAIGLERLGADPDDRHHASLSIRRIS